MNQEKKYRPKHKTTSDLKWAWPNLISEYTSMYQAWHNQQRPLMIPNDETHWFLKADNNEKLSTTYEQGYRQWESVPACAAEQRSHSLFSSKNQSKSKHLSTYKENYYQKSAMLRTPLKPSNPDHPGTFHFGSYDKLISVSQDTYRAYGKQEAINAMRQPIIIKDPEGAFPPVSTDVHKESNVRYKKDVEKKKMDFSTTQRTDYTPKKPADVPKPVARLTENEYIKRRDACCKSDLMTTFMGDYVIKHKAVERPTSYQPICEYTPPDLPFKSPSTYKQDFVRPLLKKDKLISTFKIPDTVFKHTTVYKDDHSGQRTLKSKSCYPKLQKRISRINNKFCGETFYNTTYTVPDAFDLHSGSKTNPIQVKSTKYIKNSSGQTFNRRQLSARQACVRKTKSKI